MLDQEPDRLLLAMLRRLQIVVGALVIGVILFAVAAIAIRMQGAVQNEPANPFQSYLAIVFVPAMLLARAVVLPVMTKAGRKRLLASPEVTTKQLIDLYATRTVVGSALLESAAFFLLVAYMTEGQPWTLAGGIVMAGLLAVLQFPTRPSLEAAIESDRQAIEDERASA